MHTQFEIERFERIGISLARRDCPSGPGDIEKPRRPPPRGSAEVGLVVVAEIVTQSDPPQRNPVIGADTRRTGGCRGGISSDRQPGRARRIDLDVFMIEPEGGNNMKFPDPEKVFEEERLVIGCARLVEGVEVDRLAGRVPRRDKENSGRY